MANQVSIREALLSDAQAISALIHSLARHRSPNASEPAPAEFLAGFAPGKIAESISSGSVRYSVAHVGAMLVGAVGLSEARRVQHLFVAEGFQRRGIARALWERTKADLLSSLAYYEEAEVVVRSSLYAVPVYERFGFTASGPRFDSAGVSYVPMRTVLRRHYG